jgi:hypothetical protein
MYCETRRDSTRKYIVYIAVILLLPSAAALASEPLFYSSFIYAAGDKPVSICSGDLDSDNDLDLVVANWQSNSVAVLINRSDVITGVEFDPRTPRVTRLFACYPNPFNPFTTIRFYVKNKGRVTITIYDAAGRRIMTLVDRIYPAGEFEVPWDGTNSRGKTVRSGVYFAQMVAGDHVASGKMVIFR